LTNDIILKIEENLPIEDNLELVILKGHILLEYILNKAIEIKSNFKYDLEKSTFSFSQKIDILVILNILEFNSTSYQVLKTYNTIRNQIAHRFEYDRRLVEKMIKLGLQGTRGENHIPVDDAERARAIKFLIPFLSGMITAKLITYKPFKKIKTSS
jgi:hypothetical protein